MKLQLLFTFISYLIFFCFFLLENHHVFKEKIHRVCILLNAILFDLDEMTKVCATMRTSVYPTNRINMHKYTVLVSLLRSKVSKHWFFCDSCQIDTHFSWITMSTYSILMYMYIFVFIIILRHNITYSNENFRRYFGKSMSLVMFFVLIFWTWWKLEKGFWLVESNNVFVQIDSICSVSSSKGLSLSGCNIDAESDCECDCGPCGHCGMHIVAFAWNERRSHNK